MEERLPPSLWIRLLIYVVVGHLLAGFIYLLFEVGSKAQ
ncbi:small hydrophobic protein [Streptomyces sp. 604F]|nr:small hydrophobic protein [Streptomyces sp. MBRL 601]KLI98694.1 small hydrophobic protein [Streptomyces sp. KE1]KUL59176.1 small hydrophobic protein [Streptomyces albidoflavus]MBP3076485.1 small hydrophobic protein [Streptomyces sp. 604F]